MVMAQMVKNLETWVQSLGWEDPLEEGMATHSGISCLENPHGLRSLAGYSPWGRKELDTTETKRSTRISTCTVQLKFHLF